MRSLDCRSTLIYFEKENWVEEWIDDSKGNKITARCSQAHNARGSNNAGDSRFYCFRTYSVVKMDAATIVFFERRISSVVNNYFTRISSVFDPSILNSDS